MFSSSSKVCCIITGASYGFGRAIAVQIAKQSAQSGNAITFVLTARTASKLEETKSLISEAYSHAKVSCVSGDISNTSSLPSLMDNIIEKVDPKEFSHALFISNAATLGGSSKTLKEHTDIVDINNYFSMNVSGSYYLVSRFLNSFSVVSKRCVVNIGSLAGVHEQLGLSLYCTAKAACHMMYKVIAKEEPNVRVLNYSPGPLDTDMFKDLIDDTLDPAIKKIKPYKPEFSAEKLVELLVKDEFVSGSIIDLFDILGLTR